MPNQEYKEIAQYLVAAEVEKREVIKITSEINPNLTVEEGYLVQQELVNIKMKQMNVDEPIYGYVFDYMLIENGGELSFHELIHPKVEAEIAFVIGEDIEGPGVTGAQVLAKTEYVLPALEIIDSRYENFNFTLPDVIADNASTSRVVFGTSLKKPDQLDLDLVGATLSINGEMKDLGAGAAVLGHPANSIAMLANMLSRKGEKVRKGDVILTGALTGASMLAAGDFVSGKFDGLGEVTFTVKE